MTHSAQHRPFRNEIIDHERFTVQHQGLDMKLTVVERSRVVKETLA